MTVQFAGYPPPILRKKWTQNAEPGLADIIQALHGAAAVLEGHMRGGPAVADVANPAPLNASGDRGHDHGGGEFGRPLSRPVFSSTFDNFQTFSSNVTTGAKGGFGTIDVPKAGDNENSKVTLWYPLIGWVPPCPRVSGAYVDMRVGLILDYDASYGAGDVMLAGDTVTIRLVNRHKGLGLGDGEGRIAADLTVPNPQTSGVKRIFSSTTASRLKWTQTGSVNPWGLTVKVERTTGGGASRAPRIRILHVDAGPFFS